MAASLRQRKRQANGVSSSTAPLAATANGSFLHQDLLYEILVRLPAKPLCRLRAVCQSWRSLLSDPSFAAAHSARHGPLVAAFKREQPVGVHIMDRFGHTVRHIRFEDFLQDRYSNVSCTNLDLFCFTGADHRPRVIDSATGVVSHLPGEPKFYHESPFTFTGCVIGRASSTGDAKVLGVATSFFRASSCKVLTLGGAGAGAGEWRENGCPPTPLLSFNKCVALVKGVLYFVGHDHRRGDDHIAAYDLETETWRADLLHFPPPGERARARALAELTDSLVAVYDDHNNSDQNTRDVFLDLWFLTDPDKVLWSKRYTVTMPYQGFPTTSFCWGSVAHPMWALDDGKIVFWVSHYEDEGAVHLLRVYDTRTNTCTSSTVQMPGYDFIGVYTGSLLADGLPWIRNN